MFSAAVYTALVLLVSVIPTDVGPVVGRFDKVAHFCKYLVLAWLWMRAMRVSDISYRGLSISVWAGAATYGALIEALQMLIPWRSGDLNDALANALGAALGAWIGQGASKPKR